MELAFLLPLANSDRSLNRCDPLKSSSPLTFTMIHLMVWLSLQFVAICCICCQCVAACWQSAKLSQEHDAIRDCHGFTSGRYVYSLLSPHRRLINCAACSAKSAAQPNPTAGTAASTANGYVHVYCTLLFPFHEVAMSAILHFRLRGRQMTWLPCWI